jgi:hypothetical protein
VPQVGAQSGGWDEPTQQSVVGHADEWGSGGQDYSGGRGYAANGGKERSGGGGYGGATWPGQSGPTAGASDWGSVPAAADEWAASNGAGHGQQPRAVAAQRGVLSAAADEWATGDGAGYGQQPRAAATGGWADGSGIAQPAPDEWNAAAAAASTEAPSADRRIDAPSADKWGAANDQALAHGSGGGSDWGSQQRLTEPSPPAPVLMRWDESRLG